MSFWKKLTDFILGPEAEVGAPGQQPPSPPGQPRPRPPQSGFGQPPPGFGGAPRGVPRQAPQPRPQPENPFDAGDLLRLSPAEQRAKSMKIQPWKTAWIGRVDVIPPGTDERTALIDRGLVLGGYLTEEQIVEAHRVGDQWLKYYDKNRIAAARAAKSADDAIRTLEAEAIRLKEEKKREAAIRKKQRAEDVARRKATEIIFLGTGVSGRLNDRRCHVERLTDLDLPVLATPADVAQALCVTIPHLRWLCFHAEAMESAHYTQFEVPKRTGGTRVLAAPKRYIRHAQEWVLQNILAKVPVHDAAQGFVPGRSTVTNAKLHQGSELVINLDLKDFFPSVSVHRVRGIYESLGYSPAAATVLSLICTESPRRVMSYGGKRYFVAVGDRALPQGACTSPALSNLVTRRLDKRLTGLAAKKGLSYSRYADDLTLSAAHREEVNVGFLLAQVRHIVEDEGFTVNEKKVHLQRKGGRQTVTGIVVNHPDRLSMSRTERRKLRAILNNARRTGLEAQNRSGHPSFEAHLRGKLAYLSMINPAQANPLLEQLDRLTRN